MDNELPLRSLTIHLSKENQSPEPIENSEGITTKTVVVGRRTNCPLFIKPSVAKPPSWASFIEPYVTASDFGLVSTASAVLLVPVYKRWAALTFGQGRGIRPVICVKGDQCGIGPGCFDKFTVRAGYSRCGDHTGVRSEPYDGISLQRSLSDKHRFTWRKFLLNESEMYC
jgi:hypothetical protein